MESFGSLLRDEPSQAEIDDTLSFLDQVWTIDPPDVYTKALDMALFEYKAEEQVVQAELVNEEEEQVQLKKEPLDTSKQKKSIQKKDSTTSDDGKETSLVVNKSDPYHIRQKQELKYLRKKVQVLQNELEQLERQREEEDNRQISTDGTNTTPTSSSSSADKADEAGDKDMIWKRVAKQQLLEKHKSLLENTRLKEMVQDQIKVAKSLEKIIRKRPHLSILETSLTNTAKKNRLMLEAKSNIQDEMFQSIDQMYANLNNLYRESAVYQIQKDSRNSQLFVKEQVEENMNAVYLDSCEVRCFPFSFESTGNGFWNLIVGLSKLSVVEGMHRSTEHNDDTIVAISELPLPGGSFQLTLRATMAMKRFVEKDRIVLIYESRDTCESRSHKDKFDILEVGWLIFQPLAECEDASILHSCAHFTPTLVDTGTISLVDDDNVSSTTAGSNLVSSDPRESQEVGILTEMMLGLYQKASNSIFSTLENILMEETLQKQR